MPESFALRILPFWLPLYWGLAVSAIGLCTAPISFDNYTLGGFYGFPQYYLFYYGAIFYGDMVVFIVVACIVNFLLAIAGTIHVVRNAPPVAKTRSIVSYLAITFLLCGLIGGAYCHFRTEFFAHPFFAHSDGHSVVLEEAWAYGSDTSLYDYIPFKENNKLVKIESPTLIIDSEYPTIRGAFSLYPVCAAAVQAIYHGPTDRSIEVVFDNHKAWWGLSDYVRWGTSPETFDALFAESDYWKSDMVFMFQPSEKQLQEAADKGVELVITHIGYEAFVFFVSTINPVDDLTLDQIRDIYSKKITHWNDLGGTNERILPFQRPEGSGSQTAMLRMMGDVPLPLPLRQEFRESMGGIVADVADYRNYPKFDNRPPKSLVF